MDEKSNFEIVIENYLEAKCVIERGGNREKVKQFYVAHAAVAAEFEKMASLIVMAMGKEIGFGVDEVVIGAWDAIDEFQFQSRAINYFTTAMLNHTRQMYLLNKGA